MSDKIVIIRSDDNIEYWDYHGFATIKKAISCPIGNYQKSSLMYMSVFADIMHYLNIVLVHAAPSPELVNVIATLLSGDFVRGNAALLVHNGICVFRGFDTNIIHNNFKKQFCEFDIVKSKLEHFVSTHREDIEALHRICDTSYDYVKNIKRLMCKIYKQQQTEGFLHKKYYVAVRIKQSDVERGQYRER